MKSLGWLSVGMGGLLWLVSVAVTPVLAADDPIITFDSRSEIEIDLKMVVNDFLPDLLEVAKAEDPTKAEWMEMMVDLTGVRALDRFRMTSTTTRDQGLYRSTVTLDPNVEGGLLGAMFAVPDGTFRFGKYLREEDAAMLVSLVNFSEGLKALYGMLTSPEMAAAIPPVFQEDDDGGLTLFGVNFEKDLFPLLQGELDVIVFPFKAGDMTPGSQPPMALVLGTTDGAALRAKIFELVGAKMGNEEAAQMAADPGEEVGAFSFHVLPGNAAYAVGPDFLVVTSAPDRVRAMLAEPAGNLPEKRARQYARISTSFFMQIMMAKLEESGSPEQEMFADAFKSVDEDAPLYMELTTNAGPNRLDSELRQPGNVWSLEYRMLRTMFALAPKLTASKAEREKCVATVAELDEAFTQYGLDHGGNFPEYPEELVEAGYLDAFPELTPTPLGVYADGAYTYLPVHDEDGRIKGYYFFLYGLGEGTGFDLFTPDNTADPASFRPDSDGVRDGVASFCYDGLALDHVREWNARN